MLFNRRHSFFVRADSRSRIKRQPPPSPPTEDDWDDDSIIEELHKLLLRHDRPEKTLQGVLYDLTVNPSSGVQHHVRALRTACIKTREAEVAINRLRIERARKYKELTQHYLATCSVGLTTIGSFFNFVQSILIEPEKDKDGKRKTMPRAKDKPPSKVSFTVIIDEAGTTLRSYLADILRVSRRGYKSPRIEPCV